MNKEDLRFQIDQLRKDKIIYALEAVAVDLAVFMADFVAGWVFKNDSVFSSVVIVSGLIGISYTLFMGVGNFIRLQKIKELEKKLKE